MNFNDFSAIFKVSWASATSYRMLNQEGRFTLNKEGQEIREIGLSIPGLGLNFGGEYHEDVPTETVPLFSLEQAPIER